MLKHKKAQVEYSILTLIAIGIGLLILAPFMLKAFNSFLTPFASAVSNQSVQAGESVTHIKNVFINFWDFVLVIGFLVNVILLFITAFLVDTHPVFLVLFIIFGVFSFIFFPEVLQVVDKIYNSPQLALEVSQLPLMDFFRQYSSIIMLAIWFIVGIIVYAKFRFSDKR